MGNVGADLATTALKAGKAKFAPQLVGKTGKEVPMLLREGSRAIPTAGRLLGQGAVFGTGLAAAGMIDQQSEYTQPMSSGVGTADLQKFMMSQQLQNQNLCMTWHLYKPGLSLEFRVLNIRIFIWECRR